MDTAERFAALAFSRELAIREYFTRGEPVFIASAPGRLDVMGGIADYSGSLVLQLPLDRTAVAMLQRHDAPSVDVVSLRADATVRASLPLDLLRDTSEGVTGRLAARFSRGAESHWASCVFGAAYACLSRNRHALGDTMRGFRILVHSNVSEGKGVSSAVRLARDSAGLTVRGGRTAFTPGRLRRSWLHAPAPSCHLPRARSDPQ